MPLVSGSLAVLCLCKTADELGMVDHTDPNTQDCHKFKANLLHNQFLASLSHRERPWLKGGLRMGHFYNTGIKLRTGKKKTTKMGVRGSGGKGDKRKPCLP